MAQEDFTATEAYIRERIVGNIGQDETFDLMALSFLKSRVNALEKFRCSMTRDEKKRVNAPYVIQNHVMFPLKNWCEADGDVLWWNVPVKTKPYCGRPSDEAWPKDSTHWSQLPCLELMWAADPDNAEVLE